MPRRGELCIDPVQQAAACKCLPGVAIARRIAPLSTHLAFILLDSIAAFFVRPLSRCSSSPVAGVFDCSQLRCQTSNQSCPNSTEGALLIERRLRKVSASRGPPTLHSPQKPKPALSLKATGACFHLSLLGPVEAGRPHGGLTGVTELLLPARVDLVGILLEGEEGTLDLLVGLGEPDDTIAQADVAVLSAPPGLPGLLTRWARDGTRLGSIPCGRRRSGSHWSAKFLEEGRRAQGVFQCFMPSHS